jgi:hypothetical protein
MSRPDFASMRPQHDAADNSLLKNSILNTHL